MPSSRALSKACWAHSKKCRRLLLWVSTSVVARRCSSPSSCFFGDVLGDTDDDHPLVALALLVDVALVAEPAHLAGGIEDAVLAVLDGALDQHLGQAAFGVLQVVRVDGVAPFVVVGQYQAGRAAKDALVGGADVEHLTGFPVEGPEHGVDAVEQRAVQLLAFA